ncbi:chitin deacetylase [Podila humilis]|nr:chitin deacetylase [Podila humilis]
MIGRSIVSVLALTVLSLSMVMATPIPSNPTSSSSSSSSSSSQPILAKRASAIVITACTVPNSFAVTFDDGPGTFTHELLDYLDLRQIKVTFFVNGDNYNNILAPEFSSVVNRTFHSGHQIGSHTWSHADLAVASEAVLETEMTKLDNALKTITGKRPVYMRPPYGNISPTALAYLGEKGYKVINWNVDTNDWQHPMDYKTSMMAYKGALQNIDFKSRTYISLQHDAEDNTARTLSKLAIEYVLDKGMNIMPVGTCLGDTTGWYRD